MDQKAVNPKIIILGSQGMLGQMVKKYFKRAGFEVECNDNRFTYESHGSYSSWLRSLRNVVVINCIGRIKQKTDSVESLFLANTLLPAELRNCLSDGVMLVHPSTDCVFSGQSGKPYPVDHVTDADDLYGWSKRLGEVVLDGRPNTLVVRVSIIGTDQNHQSKGLLAWVMSHSPGSLINGYSNHYWNGITTLEWCTQVERLLLTSDKIGFRIVQLGTLEHYSKYEMLLMFNEVYQLGLRVEPFETQVSIDRRLVADIICKPLRDQLKELASF
jgi:dTDP-4-dehydrorhamnose reductase